MCAVDVMEKNPTAELETLCGKFASCSAVESDFQSDSRILHVLCRGRGSWSSLSMVVVVLRNGLELGH